MLGWETQEGGGVRAGSVGWMSREKDRQGGPARGGGSPGSQVDKTERSFKSSPSSITDGRRQLPPHPSILVLHGEPGCRMLHQKPMHGCPCLSHTQRRVSPSPQAPNSVLPATPTFFSSEETSTAPGTASRRELLFLLPLLASPPES